jgi:cytochrome c oxidase subunit IIa family protein
MSTGNSVGPPRPPDRSHEKDFGHPRGTLAIVIVFGSLFLLGWLAMYVYMFLQRGAPHP